MTAQSILSHPVLQSLALSLAHFVWQGSAILIIACVALWLARRGTAAMRYSILLASLVCILHRTYDMRDLRDATSQLKELASAKDEADVKRVLGDPTRIEPSKRTRPLVETLKTKFAESPVALQADNLQIQWVKMDVKAIKSNAGNLLKTVEAKGSLSLHDVPGKARKAFA